ncbi:MAG: hypothetical protein JWN29_597 [Acidimicrobiales bacterium]|nr:hypothetical protein [Acidimicrobiales bacterium]
MTLSDDPYYTLAQTGPYEAKIGSGLITMVEPHVGHEAAYNRWYEDDHYNAGAMAFPWMWAGRRWVAPVRYQEKRYPADSVIAQPLEAGKYISTYWITEGQYENHLRFAVGTNHRLFADKRVFMERDHTFTSFQKYRGPIYRDVEGPRDIHALDYPYGGLVLEVIDSPDAETREQMLAWLHAERTPAAGSAVAIGTVFQPMPLPDDKSPYVKDVEGVDTRLTILWFTEGDSLDAWDEFAEAGDRVAASGLGRVELMAPFTPTLPGTEKYVDELRA